MHREEKVPEPDRQGRAFPSTVAIKTNGAIAGSRRSARAASFALQHALLRRTITILTNRTGVLKSAKSSCGGRSHGFLQTPPRL
jgi:hypothetical protein